MANTYKVISPFWDGTKLHQPGDKLVTEQDYTSAALEKVERAEVAGNDDSGDTGDAVPAKPRK